MKHFNAASIAAIIVLILIVVADNVIPRPGSGESSSKGDAATLQDIEAAEVELALSKLEANNRLWQTSRDEVGPQAMTWVTEIARTHFIKVSSFRPQRSTEEAGHVQMNYLVTAEGTYPNVMDFISEFETEESLLAIKLVQIGSVDGATDEVRVSISLAAYKGVDEIGQ